MDQFDKMLAKWQPTALSLFRFITGLLLFQYGVAKILEVSGLLPLCSPKVAADVIYGAPARSSWSWARC